MSDWIATLGLRLRVFLLFAGLAFGLVLALLAGVWLGGRQGAGHEALIVMALVSGLLGVTLIAGLWLLFDEHVARPIEALSGAMRMGGWGDRAAFDAPYLGDLASAGAALGAAMSAQKDRLAADVEQALGQAATSQARLELLLADLPVGVVLLSADQRLVFYNPQAAELLGHGANRPGLGRKLEDFLSIAPILHAVERLAKSADPEARSDVLCVTGAGQTLTGHLRAVPAGEGGHVLTLQDMSAMMAQNRAQIALTAELLARTRPGVAALQSLMETLSDPDGPVGETRDRIRQAARHEAQTLAQDLHRMAQAFETLPDCTLTALRASDLAEALRARVETQGTALTLATAPLMLRCDAGGVLALWSALAALVAEDRRSDFRFEITQEGAGALLSLEWQGPSLGLGALEAFLHQPDLSLGQSPRQILDHHHSDLWPEPLHDGRARLCMPLRELAGRNDPPAALPRRVTYDFDLLDRQPLGDIRASTLDRLTYVVFDTETTGLDPQRDAIVQIAGQRIVNGRVSETFDMLVNPARPIPTSATAIHGISDEMVAQAPSVADALSAFHHFAKDAVLVAHNAPFDIGLLQAAEQTHRLGYQFDHPVLDTVLLSAILFGQSQTHTLDALCDRLGIIIAPELRHSAMGDADATASAFLRMLPALKSKGLQTLSEVIIAARKHGRLIRDLNL
ncbi:exonuclease domain-containing protein [Thioclava litoralis]|uniref:DNA-directed DNA polymerase n=1 Tax=Thioclava litoralis TaxID=3076557 RepID=A0ABZ1DYT8_9RHOB|nr:exonuclease domain-containing protein [Thioclava sp. FTW29]